MRSVLVTGGTGFFGQGFVRELLRQGVERVCIYSRDEVKQFWMRKELDDHPRLRFFIGDVRDQQRLERAMDGIEVVVHAAALKRVEVGEYDSAEMVKTNVMGAMNIIEAATRMGVSKVVALSTDKACEPANCYGASKLVAEKLFLAANNSRGAEGPIFAVTRYGNVAASTGSVIPIWRKAIAEGRPVTMTHPQATRFWMTLQEAVDLVMETVHTMKGGELVIPTLPAYSVSTLALAMGADGVHVIGLQPGEKLHESMRPGETSEKARRMPVTELKEALRHV